MNTSLNDEEKAHLLKLLSDRWWRICNLYWIQGVKVLPNGNTETVKMKFRPTAIQTKFFHALHERNIVLKARQVQISTICAIIALDIALFNKDMICGITDMTDDKAKKKLAVVKFAYDHLDDPDDPKTAWVGKAIKDSRTLRFNNAHEMYFSNDSRIWASDTVRGGNCNYLWVSEFGYIAANNPDKASEILSGGVNAVHAGQMMIFEGTHEGGRFGKNYELIRLAQQSKYPLKPKDWKLHFFGWHDHPEYEMPLTEPLVLTIKQDQYFHEIEMWAKKKLTDGQKNWYVEHSKTPGVDMPRQFPGYPEEALAAQTEGAIFGEQMALLRARGRIKDLVCDPVSQLYTFWDIGQSDYTAIWLVQFVGTDFWAIDYECANGRTPAQYVAKMTEWERQYQKPIAQHFLPHDANNRGQVGKTYVDLLAECGIRNVKVVPRTPDIWVGINQLRHLLPRFYFNEKPCGREFKDESGKIVPSGLGALEGYRKKLEGVGGRIVEEPVHDEASHGASALRVLAEAHARKMLDVAMHGQREQKQIKVLTGLRRNEPVSYRS